MNTKINYMYRDAANYKIHCEEVVKGEIDEKVCEEILEDMDCEPFIRRISDFGRRPSYRKDINRMTTTPIAMNFMTWNSQTKSRPLA